MYKHIVWLFSLLLAAPIQAHDEDVPINTAAELRAWCKTESESYFIAHEKTPYNWTAKWHTEGNVLIVEGKWRVERNNVYIMCRVTKGVARKYAVFEFDDGSQPD